MLTFVHLIEQKMNKTTLLSLLLTALLTTACTTHYQVASVERSVILIDSRYDQRPDAEAAAFLAPYKHQVDSINGPVMGHSAKYMTAQRPEGTLSNLLADIMVWAGKYYQEKPDFGVYNMGGVRADLPKGTVTYGDILDIAPFENKIAFTTLSGKDVLELFSQMAVVGGEGVSHAVRMVITKDGKLVSASVNGKPVDPERDYRVVTIDYLLSGSDKMGAFKKGRNMNSPQDVSNNSRFIIMDYFKDKEAKGELVDAEIEGRVTVKN